MVFLECPAWETGKKGLREEIGGFGRTRRDMEDLHSFQTYMVVGGSSFFGI
jgi:hypothetical protein